MSWQIAIDGPAGAGKSTIAKELARKLGFEYIDTGAMYRAVTLKALNLKINMYVEEEYRFLEQTKIDFIDQHLFLDDVDVSDEIRSLEISNNVSLVAKFGYVREKLVNLQQQLALKKDVIMDGRDIGTVVLPFADLKIFLVAGIEERAKRRMNERLTNNQEVQDLETTINEIKERDFKDSNRPISPLAKAADAIEIDSSKLSVAEVVDTIIKLVLKRGYKMENLDKKVTEQEQDSPVEETVVEETNTEEVVETPTLESTPEETVVETVEADQETEDTVEEAAVETEDSVEETVEETTEETVEEEKTSKYRELQVVEGKVVEVQEAKPEQQRGKKTIKAKEERVLIQLEDGQEGFLYRKDTADIKEEEDLFDKFLEGDKLLVVIKKIYPDGGKFLFSTALLKTRNDLKQFDEIIKNHGTFVAKVVRNVNVGLLLKYNEFTCLLPSSQISGSDEDRANLIGQEIEVAPIRIDYGRIRLIVSQNVANAIRKRNDKKEFLEQIQVGQVFEGVVKNIESYGAFVELGNGIEGLLHISELDHVKVFKVEKVLKPGDTVKVQVIKIENDHIGLSRKALIPNYWQNYVADKEVGSVVTSKVIEINNAGIVVELADEVTGFLPKSEFAYERDVYINDSVQVNDTIEAKIIEIDAYKRRIILSKKQLGENPWDKLGIKVGDNVDVVVVKELKEGYKASLNGAVGYLPKSNIYNYPVDSITEGSTLKVRVRVFDPEKTRLVFGLRVEFERPEKDYGKYMKSQEKVSNTFGDYMSEKFKSGKK